MAANDLILAQASTALDPHRRQGPGSCTRLFVQVWGQSRSHKDGGEPQ